MAASKPTAEQLITENIDVWTSAIKKRGSQGRGSSKKIVLYGIKKLRELILELAVRGLLVPQDSNDKPASILLKTIAAEKEKLLKEGKIKKQKPLPEISEDDKPFELPKGWEWVCWRDILAHDDAAFKRGPFGSSLTKSMFVSEGYKVYEQYCPINDDCSFERYYISNDKFEELKGFAVKKGDYLVSCTGATLGRITQVPPDFNEGVINQALLRVRMNSDFIDPQFFKLMFRSPFFQRSIFANSKGSAIPNVKGVNDLKVMLVPFMPIQEQKRIVAKVNELMALCDQLEQQTESSLTAHQTLVETLLNTLLTAAQTTGTEERNSQSNRNQESSFDQAWNRIAQHFDVLFTTEHSIDQLKQTILQLAVMGKLVPQDPSDEPASVLLEKIAAEKEQLIKDKKIKKQKALPPIGDDEKPFELPQGWEWVRFDDICGLITSGSRGWKDFYSDSGSVFIRSQDIKYDRLEFDNRAFVTLPESSEGKRTQVSFGDLLMTITGGNVAKSAIIEEELEDAYVSQHVALIRLIDTSIRKFVHKWLTNKHGGRELLLTSSYGAKPGLNLLNIRELPIPIGPSSEMNTIVTRVDELMLICDTLKIHISESQTTQLHLADAMAENALNI
jgi:type I restriction enzyme S subunit